MDGERDVTEIERVREARRASEARFRALTERASDAILELTGDSRLLYVSPRIWDILGYSPSALEGELFFSLVHIHDLPELERIHFDAMENEESVEHLFRCRHHDGSWVWIEVGASPYRADSGELLVVWVCRDASDRVRLARIHHTQRSAEGRIAELSRRLLGLDSGSIDQAIQDGLEAACQVISADRGYLICLVAFGGQSIRLFQWNREGVEPFVERFSAEQRERHAWVWERLKAGELVRISSSADAPADAHNLLEGLAQHGIKSYLAIPVRSEDQLLGIMGFHNLHEEKTWSEQEIALLRHCAELITSALRRRSAEGALAESEERFRALAENAHDAIVEIDSDRRFRYINPAFCRLVGYTADELSVMTTSDLLHPVDSERPGREFAGGEDRFDEPLLLRVMHRNGSLRWAESTQQPFVGAEGEVHFAAVVRDVTERENRRSNAERRRALEQHIAELSRKFLALDSDMIDVAIRRSLPELAELADADEAWLMHIDHSPLDQGDLYQWYRADKTVSGEVGDNEWGDRFDWGYELLRAGDVIHIRDRARLPTPATEELDFMFFRDIVAFLGVPLMVGHDLIGVLGFEARSRKSAWTDEMIALLRLSGDLFLSALQRKRAENALRESNHQLLRSQKMEAVGTLAGGIAHDFNNQLSVILGNARFIESELDEGMELADALSDLQRAGEHCARLTRSLLAFSRHLPQSARAVRLDRVFSDVRELLKPLIPSSIRFDLQDPREDAVVRGDPTQLQQVIINLAVNARDAMPDGGELEISVFRRTIGDQVAHRLGLEATGEYLEISVRDTGIGMSASTQARIFDPFFTTKNQTEGTGLGLATVYGIIHDGKGVVNVMSREGHGTTFRILLPAAEPEDDTTWQSERLEVQQGSETVLVAEDEARVRRLMCRILARHGYEILDAGDGVEAIEIAKRHQGPIAALITDLVMPRLGGTSLASEILEIHPDVKVIFHSGYSAGSVEFPGSRFLEKPFSEERLLTVLRELLDEEG